MVPPSTDEPDASFEDHPRHRIWRVLRRNPIFWVGSLLVGGVFLVALLAPWIAPHNPDTQFPDGLSSQLGAPLGHTAKFFLGTDQDGRDVLSRLIFGARLSLSISLLGNGIAVLLGVTLGAVAAWRRGWIESVIMRLTDVMLAFPTLLLALALVAIEGPSLGVIVVVIGLVSWTSLCRITYGQVLSLREREWVDAARSVGVGGRRILVRHILPHLTGTILVYGTLGIGLTVVFESSLAYLGLGVPSPAPSWGRMVQQGELYRLDFYWLILYPSLAIFATVLGFNLLGDALRDALDPHGHVQR